AELAGRERPGNDHPALQLTAAADRAAAVRHQPLGTHLLHAAAQPGRRDRGANMKGLVACSRKELLLLSPDIHGLALLFVMPLVVVLIIALALQSQFSERSGTRLKVLVLDGDQSESSRAMLATLDEGNAFELVVPSQIPDAVTVDRQLRHG